MNGVFFNEILIRSKKINAYCFQIITTNQPNHNHDYLFQ